MQRKKTNPVVPEQTKTQECRNRVKRNICRNGSIKLREKESKKQDKLEQRVNRIYRNQIWPILKVIYRENAFSSPLKPKVSEGTLLARHGTLMEVAKTL